MRQRRCTFYSVEQKQHLASKKPKNNAIFTSSGIFATVSGVAATGNREIHRFSCSIQPISQNSAPSCTVLWRSAAEMLVIAASGDDQLICNSQIMASLPRRSAARIFASAEGFFVSLPCSGSVMFNSRTSQAS